MLKIIGCSVVPPFSHLPFHFHSQKPRTFKNILFSKVNKSPHGRMFNAITSWNCDVYVWVYVLFRKYWNDFFLSVNVRVIGSFRGRKSGALHMDEQADEESPNCILPQGEILFIRDLVHLYLKLVSVKASCANGGLLKNASSSYMREFVSEGQLLLSVFNEGKNE